MHDKILAILPEIHEIKDGALRKSVLDSYALALKEGGHAPETMARMPFTLLIKPCPFTYADHARAVTGAALAAARVMKERYGAACPIDMDALLAGAILHDVGKLLEYEEKDGEFVKSRNGKFLRHPFSGVAIGARCGVPEAVLHMIAVHAKEGDLGPRTTEAILIHHCDFINFEPFQKK